MYMNCPQCGKTCGEGQDKCNSCKDSDEDQIAEKLVATWECVVTERDGDSVWCDAYPLDDSGDREFWEIEVPGNKWTEGFAFYVLRAADVRPRRN